MTRSYPLHSDTRIFVAGSPTLIGQALCRQLKLQGFCRVISHPPGGLDLTDARETERFFAAVRPEAVFVAAGRSGGILENQRYPADLIGDNLLTAYHVIQSAQRYGVSRLLYLASSCVYPRLAPQPMTEASLMTGPLEPTSEPYAVARLAGLTLCKAFRRQCGSRFIGGIPADVFGPGDKFDPESSHVIGSLIRKMYDARKANLPSVTLWGTGTPRREFLFADDLADACLFAMQHYDSEEPINLGGGTVLSIREMAEMLREIVGYRGDLVFDTARPDGAPLKSLDSSKLLAMGWKPKTSLQDALETTYCAFLDHLETAPQPPAPSPALPTASGREGESKALNWAPSPLRGRRGEAQKGYSAKPYLTGGTV